MIAVITGAEEESALRNVSQWRTFDPAPGSEIHIIQEGTEHPKTHHKTFVRIVLIDWASKIELEAFIVDEGGIIEPLPIIKVKAPPELLVIGDSISSAMAVPSEQGGEPVPFGVLNAFPFVAQRLLLEGNPSRKVSIDFVAYPGLNLVRPTEEEKLKGFPSGMIDAFFWDSIWTKGIVPFPSSPTVILIELGTNDQAFDISKERFVDALVEFITRLVEFSHNSVQQAWLVPPFPDADTENRELNHAMESFIPILKQKLPTNIAVKLCDVVEGLTIVDGVHPRLEVHQRLGKKLADFIEQTI